MTHSQPETSCEQQRKAEMNLEHSSHNSIFVAARLLTGRAEACRVQGRYSEAEGLLRQALALAEAAFGADHLEVGRMLNNLGVLYKYMGRFDEAQTVYGRALAIIERTLGCDHPDVATIYHNLGGLEHSRGRYAVGE